MVLIWTSLSQSGCATPDPPPETSSTQGKTPVNTTSEERAAEIATKALTDHGWKVEKYEVSVTDDGESWRVDFAPEMPAPPGSDATVMVRKADSETTIHWGE